MAGLDPSCLRRGQSSKSVPRSVAPRRDCGVSNLSMAAQHILGLSLVVCISQELDSRPLVCCRLNGLRLGWLPKRCILRAIVGRDCRGSKLSQMCVTARSTFMALQHSYTPSSSSLISSPFPIASSFLILALSLFLSSKRVSFLAVLKTPPVPELHAAHEGSFR